MTKKALWSPIAILILSVVFTPLVSTILYILNWHRSEDYSRRNLGMVAYIAVLMGVLAAVFWLPNGLQPAILIINIGLGAYMYQTQKQLYQEHIKTGGKSANLIVPAVLSIGVALLLVYLMVIFANMPERSMKLFNDELFYNDATTEEERKKMASYLEAVGLFAQDNVVVTAKIERVENGLEVGFVIAPAYLKDEQALKTFENFYKDLKSDVFPGETITMQLTDNIFRVLKVIQ